MIARIVSATEAASLIKGNALNVPTSFRVETMVSDTASIVSVLEVPERLGACGIACCPEGCAFDVSIAIQAALST